MRGPVREEKEAYSVPEPPGLCFRPFLLLLSACPTHEIPIAWAVALSGLPTPALREPRLRQLGLRSLHNRTGG